MTSNPRLYESWHRATTPWWYAEQIIPQVSAWSRFTIFRGRTSLLKRSLKGTYVNVEPFHLFRYCDEQAFRFNERKSTDSGRFVKALRGITGKGLRYAKLIGGDGIQQAWETA